MDTRDRRNWDRDADLQAIRETYRRYEQVGRASLWDREAPGYRRLADELQVSLLDSLTASAHDPGLRILDLGCGDGSLAEFGRPSTSEWIGVDLRPSAVSAARERFPDLEFVTASADKVPLDDASVDVIVTRLLFSSLPSAELEASVAAEIRRLIRPTGWLVWLDLRYANPTNHAVHGLSQARIARLFPGWTLDLHTAGLLPPVARRLGGATRVAYPVLHALPMLRSHLVGRLQAPASDA